MDSASGLTGVIQSDHRQIEQLFEQLQTSIEQRDSVLPRLSSLLIAHGRATEQIYSVLPGLMPAADLISRNAGHNSQILQLLLELQYLESSSLEFDTVLQNLIDIAMAHIEDEETMLLPWLGDVMSPDQRGRLAQTFSQTRLAHLGDKLEDLSCLQASVWVLETRNAVRHLPAAGSTEPDLAVEG